MARESKKSAKGVGLGWKLWLGAVAAAMVCVSTAVAALKVHDYVLSDPQFKLSRYQKDSLVIDGIRYASRSKVQRLRRGISTAAFFPCHSAEERRRRLLAVDWVEDASVSRVWPDRLVVRIHERNPVAFVSFRSGPLLIDANGVLLEQPAQAGGLGQFSFPVFCGVREEESEADREQSACAPCSACRKTWDTWRKMSRK